MKNKFRIIPVIIVVLLIVSVSFNIVFAVDAGAQPGSDQDPIVSKSYVDAAVAQINLALQRLQGQYDALVKADEQLNIKAAAQDQLILALQNQAKSLQDQVTALQAQTKTLQDELNAVKGQPAAGGNNQGTQNAGTGTGTGKAVVNTAVLNVRSQANTTSSIVVKLAKGETVTIVSKQGDWYKIKTSKGATGFVLGKLITVK